MKSHQVDRIIKLYQWSDVILREKIPAIWSKYDFTLFIQIEDLKLKTLHPNDKTLFWPILPLVLDLIKQFIYENHYDQNSGKVEKNQIINQYKIIMIMICLIILQVYCQLQLNPINGQNFFYKIDDIVYTSGYSLQVLEPNLGFQIYGGFVEGGLNSAIQTQNVIITSLYQKMNLIGLLEYNSDYSLSTLNYSLSGFISDQNYLFNVSSVNQTCQNFEIIGYVNIILHCINTTNSQIIIYFYNNSQQRQIITGVSLQNINQLQQTTIQYYYENGIYDLYFIYISKFQSYVLNCQLFNNILSQLEQIWSQPAQYLQIFVSLEQEVFALQFNYLLYQYQNQQEKLQSYNNSNRIAMNIQYDEYDEFLIYLVNNYTIYEISFQNNFKIFSQQQLPIVISSAQIYSDLDFIFILTPKQTLIFQYQGDAYQFYQYSQYCIFNKMNQYSSLSNIIINTNSSGIQLFQLLDYFLFNNQPNQSGCISIGMFNIFNQMTQNQTIYINVLQSYQSQICPNQYNFLGASYQSNNSYQLQVDISQFYVGSNLTYNINQTSLNGVTIIYQQSNQQLPQAISFIGVYSISWLNALLNVQIQDFSIVFQIQQYSIQSFEFQQIIQSKFKLGISCQGIYFLEYDNGTIMTLIASLDYIYAFQIDPVIGLIQNYTINLNNILVNPKDFVIESGIIFNDQLIILTAEFQIITIQIFTSYYLVKDFSQTNYSYMVGYQYEQYFLFAVKEVSGFFYVDIYAWDQDQIQIYQTLQLSFVPKSFNAFDVYISPVQDGIFISYQSQIRFYEKSTFIENNIGQQQFYFQIDTTNVTFINQAQSDQFLYFVIKQNDDYFINVYQGKEGLNSLYQSIYLDANQAAVDSISISVTSDPINQCDYLAFVSNETLIYIIPHKFSLKQFPNIYQSPQFNINNIFNVSNAIDSQIFQVNMTIFQQNILINQLKNLTQIDKNQSNGVVIMNPYQYFSGTIQNYNVSCSQCQKVSVNNIITNNYFYYLCSTKWSSSYIQNQIQYIYNLNSENLFLFTYNTSNQPSSIDVTQNITFIENIIGDSLLLFLEIQTNSITWLQNDNMSILYICTINNGTQNIVNITVPGFNSSNTAYLAVYYQGILQIISNYNYSCYYYFVENQIMQLVPIVGGLFVNTLQDQEAFGSLQVQINQDNYLFGMYYLDLYSTLQFVVLNLTVDDQGFKLNNYNQFPLEEIVTFQKNFKFQYIQQYGQPRQENATSYIYLAYTTTLESGILELQFLEFNLVLSKQVCSIFIQNSTFYNNYLNLLSLNQNQVAIMSYAQNEQNSNLYLQIYLIDFDQCQSVQPYSQQLLGTFNSSDSPFSVSLNYINPNQLLLSLNGQTYVIEVNQLLEITYQTIMNSTIILTAQNLFYEQNQSILIIFSSNNTNNDESSHKIKWYWILLITIVSLIILGFIFLLTYHNLQQGNQSNYLTFSSKNEIEIKDQGSNISRL